MSAELLLFSVLSFAVLFSILLGLYVQRRFLLSTAVNWFNTRVTRSQTGSDTFRDKATLSVVLRLITYITVPCATWYILSSIPAVAVSGFLAYKLPLIHAARQRRRRLISMEHDLPIALSMFASALSGGVSLTIAIQTYTRESKTALSAEFSYLLRLQRLGVDFDMALEQVTKRVQLSDFELVALAMRISKSVGGNLSETLLTLSQSIQQKLIIEGKIRALTSQGIMQAWVMSLLPFLVGAALTAIQPEQMDKLYHTFSGNLVLGLCATMDYIGYKIIRKLLAIDV